MASGADVIYQADDSPWHIPQPWPCRLPPSGGVGRWWGLPLRGCRHEAGARRQGQRHPPDLLVRRPAQAESMVGGMAPRRARWQRTSRRDAARRRLHGLLPGLPVTGFLATLGGRDAPARPPASPSSTRTSVAGPPNASPVVARTMISASSPRRAGSGERWRSVAFRRSRRWATSHGPAQRAAKGGSLRVREQARIQLEGRWGLRYSSWIPPPGRGGRGEIASFPPPSAGRPVLRHRG